MVSGIFFNGTGYMELLMWENRSCNRILLHGEEIDSKGKKHTFVIPDEVHYEGPFDTEDEALEKIYELIFVYQ